MSAPKLRTCAQRWRYRRNLVLFAAARQGVPPRVLADVFDLSRSRVGAILDEVRGYGEAFAESRGGAESRSRGGPYRFHTPARRKTGKGPPGG